LLSIEGLEIKVKGLDALDGSPLLDLKPFIKDLDCPEDE
jgi:tRNA (Thr-GGU) A37 N-methylase